MITNLLRATIILSLFINCDAYNMLWGIGKAVVTTMMTDFQYISVRPMKTNNISNKSADVSLIIYKGSNIKSHHYLGISKSIQKIGAERGINIDIKIPHFPYIKNFDNDIRTPTFVLGHSSGAYDFLLYHNISKYDGFIQVGSVLNSNGKLPWKSRKLEEFPIPVMTLVGKNDGYLRHIYCLDEMYNQNETERYKTKPIIIMPNITHLHISNTTSSHIANLIGMKDMKSIIDVQTAWDMLALCIVDFIILNSGNNSQSIAKSIANSSLQRMKTLQSETRALLSSYLKFDNIDGLKELLGILHMFLNTSTKCNVYFLNYYDFLLSKPSKDVVYFYKEGKSMFSKMYFTPLWVKTKYELYFSARKFNKFLFHQMSNNYQQDIKMKIVFRPDKKCSTTLEWILSDVSIERQGQTIYVQCPVFLTNKKSIVYKNYYYLKILSPAQMLELINIDLQDTKII